MVGFCEEVLIGGGEKEMPEFYERVPAGGEPEYRVGVDIFLFVKVEEVDQGKEVLVHQENQCKRVPKCDVSTVWMGKGFDFDQKVMLFSKNKVPGRCPWI